MIHLLFPSRLILNHRSVIIPRFGECVKDNAIVTYIKLPYVYAVSINIPQIPNCTKVGNYITAKKNLSGTLLG